MNAEDDFDIVIATLEKERDILQKITDKNIEMNMFNIMDTIRLEQIDELNKAIKLWKTRDIKLP